MGRSRQRSAPRLLQGQVELEGPTPLSDCAGRQYRRVELRNDDRHSRLPGENAGPAGAGRSGRLTFRVPSGCDSQRSARGRGCGVLYAMAEAGLRLDPAKFRDPVITVTGAPRAQVALRALDTLWFNTGTLCNLACHNCYIESSPKNDRLAYLSAAEVGAYLDEIAALGLGTGLIGFTGGEPFMNPEFPALLDLALERGFRALVLTNAMKPMHKQKSALLGWRERYCERLTIRVSIDHYGRAVHEAERGQRSWQPTIDGLRWLVANGFAVSVASRQLSGEPEPVIRNGFARLFAELGVPVDAADPE